MNKNINDFFVEELQDMLSAEEQNVEILTEMIAAAESSDLKETFRVHLKETKVQGQRLERVLNLLGISDKDKVCKAMKGLVQECREVVKGFAKSPVRDAALIAKAQRIEHYEIAAYSTLKTLARELGFSEVTDLLQDSLDEETYANKHLARIAEGGIFRSGVNHRANTVSNNRTTTTATARAATARSRASTARSTTARSATARSTTARTATSNRTKAKTLVGSRQITSKWFVKTSPKAKVAAARRYAGAR